LWRNDAAHARAPGQQDAAMVVLSFYVVRGGLVFVLAFPAENRRAAWAEQGRFIQCGRISATGAEVP
jgi:hypothetical protein